MELQLFIHKNIAIHFYYSEDSIKDGKVFAKNIFAYFPGLPQIQEEDFFASRVNKDTAFFSVYYYGSWLSGENFSYENCKKTIELAIDFVKSKKGVKTFDNQEFAWDYENLHVVGYSFAGNPVASAKLSKNDVKNVFLLSPLLFVNKIDTEQYFENTKDLEDFYGFSLFYLEFLKRGYKFAFRGIDNPSWEKYFSGEDQESVIKIADDYPNIFVLHGKEDKKISYKSSVFFQKEKCPTASLELLDNVGHDSEKLFDMEKINKFI